MVLLFSPYSSYNISHTFYCFLDTIEQEENDEEKIEIDSTPPNKNKNLVSKPLQGKKGVKDILKEQDICMFGPLVLSIVVLAAAMTIQTQNLYGK